LAVITVHGSPANSESRLDVLHAARREEALGHIQQFVDGCFAARYTASNQFDTSY